MSAAKGLLHNYWIEVEVALLLLRVCSSSAEALFVGSAVVHHPPHCGPTVVVAHPYIVVR